MIHMISPFDQMPETNTWMPMLLSKSRLMSQALLDMSKAKILS